jgi:hypothetical protein
MPATQPNQSSDPGLQSKPTRIGGFALLELIHEGSCGALYRARQERVGRVVALKVLPEWPPPTDVALERFNRAAYVSAQVPHPNLMTLYDTGTADGFHFASLEYVPGQTLQQHLAVIGAADEQFALRIAAQVLRALTALHARTICHRNVKPKNLFLEPDGKVRLIGLGLASCRTAFFSPHLDARPIGTPHFMAPEMIRGSYADPRSDLYSLGVTLYVAVTGQTPFEKGSPLSVMSRHLTEAAIPLADARPGLSREFVAFVEALMAREPDQRFQSAQAALEVCDALAARFPAQPPAPAMLAAAPAPRPVCFTPSRSERTHPATVAILSAAVTAVVVAGLLLGLWLFRAWNDPARENTPAAPDGSATPARLETAEARDFARLVELDDHFSRTPAKGVDAWSDYLRAYPNAPAAKQAIARARLDRYLGLAAAPRGGTPQPAQRNPDHLDF